MPQPSGGGPQQGEPPREPPGGPAGIQIQVPPVPPAYPQGNTLFGNPLKEFNGNRTTMMYFGNQFI